VEKFASFFIILFGILYQAQHDAHKVYYTNGIIYQMVY